MNKNIKRPFLDAKSFVNALNLKSVKEWKEYINNEFSNLPSLPADIPKNPASSYKDNGWKGYTDWLGYESFRGNWCDYEEANKFVLLLGLKSNTEWKSYCSGKFSGLPIKFKNIPSSPSIVYKDSGWISWPCWLGYTRRAGGKKKFRSFISSKEFVNSLNLKNIKEWYAYLKGEFPEKPLLPDDIPVQPKRVYENNGWVSYSDWIGCFNRGGINRKFLDYNEAKKFVLKLNLKTSTEWRNYCQNKYKHLPVLPLDIPKYVREYYKDKGWISWENWLGYCKKNNI